MGIYIMTPNMDNLPRKYLTYLKREKRERGKGEGTGLRENERGGS